MQRSALEVRRQAGSCLPPSLRAASGSPGQCWRPAERSRTHKRDRKRPAWHYVQLRAQGAVEAPESNHKVIAERSRHPPRCAFFLCPEGSSSLCPADSSSSFRMQTPVLSSSCLQTFCPSFQAVIIPKLLESLRPPPPTTEKAVAGSLPPLHSVLFVRCRQLHLGRLFPLHLWHVVGA